MNPLFPFRGSFSSFPRTFHSKSPLHQTKTSLLVGPAVRLLLGHYDIKTSVLRASGPKKNILKGDVLSHINDKKLSPIKTISAKPPAKMSLENEVVSASSHPIIPLKSSRRSEPTHRHVHVDIQLSEMCQNQTKQFMQSRNSIPHAYASSQISANKILELLNRLSERVDFKLSLNDFIIKACSLSLRFWSVPELNVHWHGNSIHRLSSVDISVALATPNGFVTPVLSNVDQLSLLQISARLRELTARARDGQLRPEEFQGGTFTISSLDIFDSVSDFTAVINSPQAANLTIGALRRHFEPDETTKKPKLVTKFGATLCYDARTIEGQTARRFLDSFKTALISPESLFAELDYLIEDEVDISEMDDDSAIEEKIDIGKEDEELAKLLLR